VCIAASIAGDTSQDLKTGFVLGATPRFQQIGEMIGVITSAGFVCLVVMMLHRSVPGGLGGAELPAPQAVLMKLVIDGVLDQSLPWTLILIGLGIGVVASLFKIPVLAFAVGVYLPLYTMAAVFAGGLMRHLLTRKAEPARAESRRERGVLFGSGLVGGGGLTGVVLAVWVVARGGEPIRGFPPDIPNWAVQIVARSGGSRLTGVRSEAAGASVRGCHSGRAQDLHRVHRRMGRPRLTELGPGCRGPSAADSRLGEDPPRSTPSVSASPRPMESAIIIEGVTTP
jgi:hypothetical protein